MAIAVGSVSTNQTVNSAASLTYAFDNVAGNVLAVMATNADNGFTTTGVTYNAVAMSLGVSLNSSAASADLRGWYLASPATGSNNVVVTSSGSVNQIQSGAISFTGANTASPLGDTATHDKQDGVADAPKSVSITSNNANQILVTYWQQGGTFGSAITMTGSDETANWTRLSPSRGGAMSRIPTTATGSYTSTMQPSGGDTLAVTTIIWGIKEAAAAAATVRPVPFLNLLGVGT